MSGQGLRTCPPSTRASLGRRRGFCLLWFTLTVPSGLLWRFAPLALSPFTYKYGGSALWAAALYWMFGGLRPFWRPAAVAAVSAATAVAVECFKLVHSPTLDHFRRTLAGKVLLGRVFTLGAMVAYCAAIVAIMLLDHAYGAARAARLGSCAKADAHPVR